MVGQMIDKNNFPVRLEGKTVILDEIQPKYFSYVIKWRNNPELNKFLNQPYELTEEIEQKWFEEIYSTDDTQALFVLIDKEKSIPFGTIGWTDFDAQKKRRIGGRMLVGDSKYLNQPAFIEGNFLISDFSYESVDIEYIHVVKKNRKALRMNKLLGFIPNDGQIQYPHELFRNGMEQQEFYRTKEMYIKTRKKLWENLAKSLFD